MDNNDFNQIQDLKIQLATLQQEVQEIKIYLNNDSSHRISFLTWSLTNPLALVIYPTVSVIFIQLLIINKGISFENMSLNSLTNGVNWTLPLIIFLVGIYLSFTNKLYTIIQENADMNIFKMLEASINRQSKRFEIERETRDYYQANKETEYEADKERRDQEIKDLISELQSIKLSQAKIESTQTK